MDIDGFFYMKGNRISIAEIKTEYIKTKKSIMINAPSVKVLPKEKTKIYLQKLKEAGIKYYVFG